ncbi:MAG: hypothetical protein V3T86_10830 [Planctomycetota bacterium]
MRFAIPIVMLLATAASAQSVDELRAALKDQEKRPDALDEIARYWEGRDELEPDVRALVATDWRAAWALGMKRTISEESIDALAKHVDHLAAQWALGRTGVRAIPAILAGLNDLDRRDSMCGALMYLGPAGRPAAFAILTWAIDGSVPARNALHEMAPLGAPLLKALISGKAEDDLELLCCVGPHAFSRLRKSVGEEHDLVIDALARKPYGAEFFLDEPERFGPYVTDRIAALMNEAALVRALPHTRAFRALQLRGPWGRGAEVHLRAYLGTEHQDAAIDTMAAIGVTQAETVQQLDRVIRNAEVVPKIRDTAALALVSGDTGTARVALAKLVANTTLSSDARMEILHHLATKSPELLKPQLKRLVNDRSLTMRIFAEMFMSNLAPEHLDTERYRKRFRTCSWRTQARILEYGCELGFRHDVLRARIRKLAKSKFPQVRLAAAVAQATFEPLPQSERDWMVRMATTPGSARDEAILALGRLPAGDTESLQLLFLLAAPHETYQTAFEALMLRRDVFSTATVEQHPDITTAIVYARGDRSDTELNALLEAFVEFQAPSVPNGSHLELRLAPRLLRSRDAATRSNAAWTLHVGGTTEDIPALRRCPLDPDVNVRIAAWDAIEAIQARAAGAPR